MTAIFEAAGCENVRTFIQSGNVIFAASAAVSKNLAVNVITSKIEAEAQFRYRTPVILRTREQLRDAVRNNPFLKPGRVEDALHVMFLADRPNQAKIATLDPNRSAPDAFAVVGQEIYLHLPERYGQD